MRTLFRISVLLALGLAVSACKDGNPVAPPTDTGGLPDALAITITSNVSQVEAGTVTPATLTIVARHNDGTPAPEGTKVTINTSLGNFGVDASGNPIQLIDATLSGGRATVQFFAGSKLGTANILAQIGTNIGRLNLPIVEAKPLPVPDFTFSASGLSVLFTDASTGASTYQWQFGDGGTSTERNPMHTYSSAATYAVTLTVANSTGSATTSKFVPVSLGTPPVAAFEFVVTANQVNFTDRSTGDPTSWTWVFGDGESTNQRNPIHNYPAPGSYTVSLTATNAAGSNTTSQVVTISAGPAPEAKFDFQVNGKQVNFVDQSTGNPTVWSWDFGDGQTSGLRNPVHTYATAGLFTVQLMVSNQAGSSTTSKAVKIESGVAPVAAFDFTVNGKQANFVDRSTGSPTSWSWTFGDGGTSTQQNPVHTYATGGSYTVVLTVANASGSSNTSKVVTIANQAAPVANFEFTAVGLQVNFVDRSTNSPAAWFWNFGDGSPQSQQQNPVHTYAAPGGYTVTLTVVNDGGTDQISKVVTVTNPAP